VQLLNGIDCADFDQEEGMPMPQITALFAVIVFVGFSTAVRAEILKREPPLGMLKPGQIALIDDGSCPKGKIKKVIGGDHVKVGGRSYVERKRMCVAR